MRKCDQRRAKLMKSTAKAKIETTHKALFRGAFRAEREQRIRELAERASKRLPL